MQNTIYAIIKADSTPSGICYPSLAAAYADILKSMKATGASDSTADQAARRFISTNIACYIRSDVVCILADDDTQ